MVGFNWTATMARSCNKRVCLADSLDISCPFTCDCSQVTQDDWIDVFTNPVLDKVETEDMGEDMSNVIITRKDYMASSKDFGMHRKYYAQFVNKEIENLILKRIGMDRLLASTDKNFNDIYIGDWDMMIVTLKDKRTGRVVTDQYMHGNFVGSFNTHVHSFNFDTRNINAALKRCGDIPSINSYVCIFKECARQMVEHHKERGE